ncbi:NPCBM/NEW2 domain-containing protein [Lentzea kentuckyensis]|uniref:NPCBM/NEW2 domain-containing protein n=1 Tax=Lentzea kentuckyensis TaxID=360086 RepID=UPI000A39DAC4|nr:NPCBM/NEW2 domain-containing protein [Lentzea kentuckyensis]
MRRRIALIVSALLPLSLIAPTAAGGEPSAAVLSTPPLGWNSWNQFGCNIDENLIRQTADAIVSSGMRDAGYTYVNIDDCWMARDRDAEGRLQADPTRFPSGIKALADYVHGKSLKLGIYSSAGTKTCAGFPASIDHEETDARTWADWGVDYLKYDNCYNENRPALDRYRAMGEALRKTGRNIVYSLCEWGQNRPWEGLGRAVGGHLWRTTGDISDNWTSVMGILDQQVGLERYAGPDGWNDPDMLEVGNGGMTDAEYRAHFALWSVLNAPLIAGNDVRSMDDATKRILLNRDLLAVNQDWSGTQGRKVRDDGDQEVWAKPMSDGSVAVVLLNRGTANAAIGATATELGLPAGRSYRVKDLWSKEQHASSGMIRGGVLSHGAVTYRVWPGGTAKLAPLTSFTLAGPELVDGARPFTVTTGLVNDGTSPLIGARVQLQVPDGWVLNGPSVRETPLVLPGRGFTTTWTVTARPVTSAATVKLTAGASYHTTAGAESRWSEIAPPLVTAPSTGAHRVSGLPFVSEVNSWGPVERDRSNGEQSPTDGKPITIGGVRYQTGLGVHAASSVRIYLGTTCSAFTAQVGVDDETNGLGSVSFRVLGDGRELAVTPVLRGGAEAVPVQADVTGVRMLDLQVTDGGDGNNSDHADWAAATITC